MNIHAKKKGFVALIAVVALSMSGLVFALVVAGAASAYSDLVLRRELRIQANLNAKSCLEVVTMMIGLDVFLEGPVSVRGLGCRGTVQKSPIDHVWNIDIKTELEGISSIGHRRIFLDWDSLDIEDEEVL